MNIKNRLIAITALFLTVTAASCAGPSIVFHEGEDRIDVTVAGEPFTSYLHGDDLTKPILYPLYSPSGIRLNRGFPLVEVKGESRDHPHHAGLFFTYDRVNDTGFWNNTTSPPRIEHVEVAKAEGGRGEATLAIKAHWTGMNGEVLLEERRMMVFSAASGIRTIDFEIELEAGKEEVVFFDTKEGMFGIRVAPWLKEKGGSGEYLASTGERTAKNVWGRRAAWVRLQGKKDGAAAGIMICDHPDSVNHPTFWHARDYGLFAANPLGQAVFERSRGNKEALPFRLVLAPGETASFRFRVILYEGDRTVPELESWYAAFTAPAN